MPFSSCTPRSSNARPDPTIRSRTVCETSPNLPVQRVQFSAPRAGLRADAGGWLLTTAAPGSRRRARAHALNERGAGGLGEGRLGLRDPIRVAHDQRELVACCSRLQRAGLSCRSSRFEPCRSLLAAVANSNAFLRAAEWLCGPSAWMSAIHSLHKKTADLRRFHGASRTRTGDLLGAISALSGPEFGLTSGFPSLRVSSPNTFPNTLQPVLQ